MYFPMKKTLPEHLNIKKMLVNVLVNQEKEKFLGGAKNKIKFHFYGLSPYVALVEYHYNLGQFFHNLEIA